MFSVLKDAFKIVNYNLLLTIPLIIFVKIFDLYTTYVGVDSNSKLLVASFTVMLMFSVFCSGWLYMIKGAVDLSKKVFIMDTDRAKASMQLFKSFLEGVGKFFIPFIGVYIIFFFIQLIFTIFTLTLGVHLIGTPDAASMQTLQNLAATGNNSAAISDFVNNMSPELIAFFGKWSLLFIVISSVLFYLLMFWAPEILNLSSNPLTALYNSWKKMFNKFFPTLGLYAILWLIGFVLLFMNTFSMINPFVYLFMNLVIFYFQVYFAVVIFLYYDKKLLENNEE